MRAALLALVLSVLAPAIQALAIEIAGPARVVDSDTLEIGTQSVRIHGIAPWSKHYAKTRIDTAKGERWFCAEAEAIAAGWRAPYR